MLIWFYLVLKKLLMLCVIVVVLLALIAVFTYQPLPKHRTDDGIATTPASDGVLAQQLSAHLKTHQQLTGIYPLNDGKDAFVARLALIEQAKYTLDVQYYIWHDDISGRLLLQYVYQAAQRGVSVRLLLDDNNTKDMDKLLLAMDSHPNIQVRLFNPFMQRNLRPLGYLSDFFRLNRRMHNKSLTADGLATIVGGRNIGDEYFGAGTGVMFADLDVLATGAVVQSVNDDFYAYWQSQSVYPLQSIVSDDNIPAFDATPAKDKQTQEYLTALQHAQFVKQLQTGSLPMSWVNAYLVSDSPTKGLGKATMEQTLLSQITPLIEATKNELLIISPYFVPTHTGSQMFANIAKQGKDVHILTNALSATDVAPVHAGYAKYRKPLLKAGVHLYELKPDATIHTNHHGGIIHSSGASLHAKTFAIDRQKVFVGSFNMDPRSAKLNTEMGLVIDSPALAQTLVEGFYQKHAQNAYTVHLSDKKLHWQTQNNGQLTQYETEPQSPWIQRMVVMLCSWLPIEWLL